MDCLATFLYIVDISMMKWPKFLIFDPDGQKISSVQSTYKWFSGKSDRKWYLECTPSPLGVYGCYWTGYVNDWDRNVNFNCENGMITGIYLTKNQFLNIYVRICIKTSDKWSYKAVFK